MLSSMLYTKSVHSASSGEIASCHATSSASAYGYQQPAQQNGGYLAVYRSHRRI